MLYSQLRTRKCNSQTVMSALTWQPGGCKQGCTQLLPGGCTQPLGAGCACGFLDLELKHGAWAWVSHSLEKGTGALSELAPWTEAAPLSRGHRSWAPSTPTPSAEEAGAAPCSELQVPAAAPGSSPCPLPRRNSWQHGEGWGHGSPLVHLAGTALCP